MRQYGGVKVIVTVVIEMEKRTLLRDRLEKEMATHSSLLAWRISDRGAWWAAVYGVTQSRTRLKRLSSSSRDKLLCQVLEENF